MISRSPSVRDAVDGDDAGFVSRGTGPIKQLLRSQIE
jgi:hypothetical protein